MSRYIKTDALMEDIWSLYRDEDHIDYNVAIVDALNVIDEQPTADVRENVKGEWQVYYDEDSPQDGIWKCSICSYTRLIDDISPTNYCPNCGADMRGEEDEI